MLQLPNNFFDERVYIQVNRINIEAFAHDLDELGINRYYDMVNFVLNWDHSNHIVACYWDDYDKCVHINGDFKQEYGYPLVSYESLLQEESKIADFSNLL